MQVFHIERHALEVPHRIDSFYSMCTFHIENYFIIKVMWVKTTSILSGPATSNFQRNFPPLLYVENTIFHCMWKIHLISTFFSESGMQAELPSTSPFSTILTIFLRSTHWKSGNIRFISYSRYIGQSDISVYQYSIPISE